MRGRASIPFVDEEKSWKQFPKYMYTIKYIGISFTACIFYSTVYVKFSYTVLRNILNKVIEVI